MREKTKSLVLILSCCIAVLWPFTAQAGTISFSNDPSLYGNLNQHNIDFAYSIGEKGCGPTSEVNALMFLQNQYPGIYGTKLVPGGDLVNAALNMASDMNTTVDGTSLSDFISGLKTYVNNAAPGTTMYSPEKFKNDPDTWMSWVYQELSSGDALEALMVKLPSGEGHNHFITVYGVSWNSDSETGTLSFVDPYTGQTATEDVVYEDNVLYLDYFRNGEPSTSSLYGALAEGPTGTPTATPEPCTLMLLVGSFLGLGGLLRRRK
jgi:hypothetical protein